ncbi:MAG: DUF3822 family protein [Bacteroidales bacterium]|nr:DUF3822 family protein [Bacteroidales bacterium]
MTDPSKTLYYNITIQCSLDGFCFVIHHQEENKIIDMKLYQTSEATDESVTMEAMEKALFKKELLGKPFLSVRFIVSNRYNTIVPAELFEASKQEAYLRFNHALPQGYKVFHEPLDILNAVNVFALPESQYEHLCNTWTGIKFTHQTTAFLNGIMREEAYESNTNAYVNVNSRSFDLAIVKDGKLDFFNNFKFNTKEDFVYFLMLTLKQQLEGRDVPVHFSGLISNNSEIIRLCERYIKRIRFVRPDGSVNVDLSLSSIPFQYYYIPYKNLSCES